MVIRHVPLNLARRGSDGYKGGCPCKANAPNASGTVVWLLPTKAVSGWWISFCEIFGSFWRTRVLTLLILRGHVSLIILMGSTPDMLNFVEENELTILFSLDSSNSQSHKGIYPASQTLTYNNAFFPSSDIHAYTKYLRDAWMEIHQYHKA